MTRCPPVTIRAGSGRRCGQLIEHATCPAHGPGRPVAFGVLGTDGARTVVARSAVLFR
ncbi:hypothetical protein ACFYZ9_09980 [Streptomyces sp. NPDC001691]|uniref:hypothetical protein n=1 Tax=Streptomyces sp. NPDC001691 TaxID=3364600 RepID=UPI003678DD2F